MTFWLVLIIVLLIPVASNFYKYYYSKNYYFLIEAECDSSKENCYLRDCSITDECPPNGYSTYKQYYVKAFDFLNCADNSCSIECKEKIITCLEIPCGDSDQGICSGAL